MYDPKEEIKHALEMIALGRNLTKAINELVVESPEYSEIGAEIIEDNKQQIKYYSERIKRVQNGEKRIY